MLKQLKKDGSWGEPATFGFVNAKHVVALCESLADDVSAFLTVGLAYRNPTTCDKRFAPDKLAAYVRDTLGDHYWYDVKKHDDRITVTALSSNDLY